jgi:hypothetical protein
MNEFLSKFRSDEIIGMLTIVGGLIFLLVSIVGYYWHKIHKTSVHAALKQDMLNRGMSAEEIKTVLEAGPKK